MILDVLNVAACALLSGACAWAVLSPRVQDGIVIKLGLIAMQLGLMGLGAALAVDKEPAVIDRTLALLNTGLLTVAVGVWLRWRRAGRVYRIDEWVTPPTTAMRRGGPVDASDSRMSPS